MLGAAHNFKERHPLKNDPGFTPAGNRVLVAPHEDEPAQDGKNQIVGVDKDDLIVIPDSVGVGKHVYKCVVIAVGAPVTRCKVGDTVILPLCGYELLLSRNAYRVVPEDDILGVLNEGAVLVS